MIDKIKEYLEQTITDYAWVLFGSGTLASVPYGVIKGEKEVGGRGIRVILHRNQGEQILLEDGLRTLINTLTNKGFTSRNGNYNQLGRLIDYTDVVAISGDSTITMDALFLMPTTTF